MKPVLLCLHGWGGSQESFAELREALKDQDLEILTPDLPGFGQEPDPPHPWQTDDYVAWVESYIRTHIGSRPFLLLGHSHGGRIAIKLVSRTGSPSAAPAHLFLCAAAGIRHPRHFKRIVGLTIAKAGKFFLSIPGLRRLQPLGRMLLYQLVRVHDYEKASPVMRETLIKVSAEDLTPLLEKVTIPTDIFWGRDDRMTPYTDALLMRERIKGSVLHAYPCIRHRVHRDKAKDIAEVIVGRLKSGNK